MKTLIAKQTFNTPDFKILYGDFAKVVSENQDCYKIEFKDETSYVNKKDENILYRIYTNAEVSRIYFVSQYDNKVHNVNDWEHQVVSEMKAYIGKDCGEDGFRVDEEVNLWTIKEIASFYE